jgi:hypothetical protein
VADEPGRIHYEAYSMNPTEARGLRSSVIRVRARDFHSFTPKNLKEKRRHEQQATEHCYGHVGAGFFGLLSAFGAVDDKVQVQG